MTASEGLSFRRLREDGFFARSIGRKSGFSHRVPMYAYFLLILGAAWVLYGNVWGLLHENISINYALEIPHNPVLKSAENLVHRVSRLACRYNTYLILMQEQEMNAETMVTSMILQ
jgi:hypothetical protein